MKKFLIFLNIILGGFYLAFSPLALAESEVINENIPEIYIKAVNPGYTVDGKSNVGEMIEIARKNADIPVLLAGATVGYTNSSGSYSILFEFPEYSWLTGESLLLRLASSPDSELAATTYTKTLAFSAAIEFKMGDEVVDKVCWTGKDDCYKAFKSSNPTTLVRNLETGEFEHLTDYMPEYNEESYHVDIPAEESQAFENASQCKGLEFSEVLSYYENSKSEQFVEFYNPKSEQILLNGCKLRYKNKNYNLDGVVLPEGYFVYYVENFSLTKNPNSYNTLELVDVDGAIVDSLKYPKGQRKGTSYAFIGYDKKGEEIWKVTFAPTPGEPNNYQEFRTCEKGKVINEATGNCVKVTTIAEKVCKEGYYLNPETNRCRKIKTTKAKTCKEGYYLDSNTNRCRKIKENNGANYSLEPENYEEKSSFIALYAILGIICVGLVYLIYEFRHEILGLINKVFRRSR